MEYCVTVRTESVRLVRSELSTTGLRTQDPSQRGQLQSTSGTGPCSRAPTNLVPSSEKLVLDISIHQLYYSIQKQKKYNKHTHQLLTFHLQL